jgi:hypothetical protein
MTGDEPHVDGPADCESDGAPFDLHAVLADDALLEALGPDGLDGITIRERFADSHPDTLIDLLLSVRETAGAVEVREPDADDSRLVSTGCDRPASRSSPRVRESAPGRRRFRRISLTLAAAALTAAFLAPGIGARAAGPGDALWPVTIVLYPGRVVSVRAVEQVSRRLDAAAAAMAAGNDQDARIELQAAESQLDRVSAKDGRPALQARQGDLDHALHAATRTDGDAGTRTKTPSTGPARDGPAAYPIPPTPTRGAPTATPTTITTITTGLPTGPPARSIRGRAAACVATGVPPCAVAQRPIAGRNRVIGR